MQGAAAGFRSTRLRIQVEMRDKSTLANDFNQKGAEFLIVELQTGLTFANLALTAEPGSADRVRDQDNARKAYQTVLRLRGRFQAPPEAARTIEDGLGRLRSALDKLDEKANELPSQR